MSWIAIFVLAAGCYFFKVAGVFAGRTEVLPSTLQRALALLPAALLAALTTQGIFTTDESLVVDERVLGLGAAAIAVRLNAPFVVTVIVGGGATALYRSLVG